MKVKLTKIKSCILVANCAWCPCSRTVREKVREEKRQRRSDKGKGWKRGRQKRETAKDRGKVEGEGDLMAIEREKIFN